MTRTTSTGSGGCGRPSRTTRPASPTTSPFDDPRRTWLAAVAIGCGATVIEKHLTTSLALRETDFQAALNPDDFAPVHENMRAAAVAFGPPTPSELDDFGMSENERGYRTGLKKQVVARRDLRAGPRRSGQDDQSQARPRRPPTSSTTPGSWSGSGSARTSARRADHLHGAGVNRRLAAVLACRANGTRLYGKPLQNLAAGVTILDQIVAAIRTFPNSTRSSWRYPREPTTSSSPIMRSASAAITFSATPMTFSRD